MWSKAFITVVGHENKFVTPEGDEMYSEKVFLL